MIETRHDDIVTDVRESVRQGGRSEQFIVGHIGEQVLVQSLIARQSIGGPNPDMIDRRQLFALPEIRGSHRAKFERPFLGEKTLYLHWHAARQVLRDLVQCLKSVRAGHIGHHGMMLKPFFGDLERRGKIKDRPAVLNRDDAAIGEAAAIARTVNLVDYGRPDVSPAQKIGVQRVSNAVIHGMLRSRQRLTHHLTAENLWAADITAVAAENIVLDALELQQRNQVFEGRIHRPA